MKKEILDERIKYNNLVQDGDNIDTVMNSLVFLRQQIKPYHTRHEFEIDYVHNNHDSGYNMYLRLYRLETDQECSDRIEHERILNEALQKEQDAELAEYERLKAKYGK